MTNFRNPGFANCKMSQKNLSDEAAKSSYLNSFQSVPTIEGSSVSTGIYDSETKFEYLPFGGSVISPLPYFLTPLVARRGVFESSIERRRRLVSAFRISQSEMRLRRYIGTSTSQTVGPFVLPSIGQIVSVEVFVQLEEVFYLEQNDNQIVQTGMPPF